MVQKIKRLTPLGLIARILITAILGVLLIAVFYPLFWMVLSGFKDTTGLLTNPFGSGPMEIRKLYQYLEQRD